MLRLNYDHCGKQIILQTLYLDKNNNSYQNNDIVFYGHTHVSKYEVINGVRYINPGSTTIPKENTKKSFIVFDEKNITLYDIDGNILNKWEI